MSPPILFHVDMDAFYASIEQLDDPSLRGTPVIVGGRGKRGVVAACSYESRPFGVHSAMPMAEALRKCPEARVVPPRMRRYRELSRAVMRKFTEYSPVVQAISVDEAFLDMTGTERLLGPPRDTAARIKREIRRETGLTISVGIGPSRFIAKLASDADKPDGLYEVLPGEEEAFVAGLELRELWGLGAASRRRLERLGITTVPELKAQRIEYLRGHFGSSAGEYLYQIARGRDPGIYAGSRRRHSISSEETFEEDLSNAEEIRRRVLTLAEDVFHRSITEHHGGRTIQVKLRFPPFETHTVSRTLSRQLDSSEELARVCFELLEARRQGRPVRLIGVGIAGHVNEQPDTQGDLFRDERATALDPTVVELRRRFGPQAIARAGTMPERGAMPEHDPDDEHPGRATRRP